MSASGTSARSRATASGSEPGSDELIDREHPAARAARGRARRPQARPQDRAARRVSVDGADADDVHAAREDAGRARRRVRQPDRQEAEQQTRCGIQQAGASEELGDAVQVARWRVFLPADAPARGWDAYPARGRHNPPARRGRVARLHYRTDVISACRGGSAEGRVMATKVRYRQEPDADKAIRRAARRAGAGHGGRDRRGDPRRGAGAVGHEPTPVPAGLGAPRAPEGAARVTGFPPHWHWFEYGTRWNPPYAPIRRTVERLGLRYQRK